LTKFKRKSFPTTQEKGLYDAAKKEGKVPFSNMRLRGEDIHQGRIPTSNGTKKKRKSISSHGDQFPSFRGAPAPARRLASFPLESMRNVFLFIEVKGGSPLPRGGKGRLFISLSGVSPKDQQIRRKKDLLYPLKGASPYASFKRGKKQGGD